MMQDAAPCADAGRLDEANYLSTDYFDAHLTEEGWRQAHALRAHIKALPEPLGVDVVIVSPLTRALETAVGVWRRRVAPQRWWHAAHDPTRK